MSGHSKWAQIKRKKGVADVKRGAAFTRLGREISIAAREGGGDPSANFTLRLAIEKARGQNMPKENIERAIKRGTGELSEGGQLEEMMYEGYGPGGTAVLVQILTDNRNRAAAEVRHMFTRGGGNLAAANAVAWMFDKKGVITLENVEKSGRPRAGINRCGRGRLQARWQRARFVLRAGEFARAERGNRKTQSVDHVRRIGVDCQKPGECDRRTSRIDNEVDGVAGRTR